MGEAIRQYSLSRLPDLLEQLEQRLGERGVQVHWAATPEDANAIFLALAQAHGAKGMIKGKSMVSEEIELNHRMAEQGVDCLESDMGEYIVQLAGERPSHIIMPAIHKTKQQIADLFAQEIPDTPYTEDVDALIAIGRRVLRNEFRDAAIGVSGVNFMVAETGTLCLVENEGNGRMWHDGARRAHRHHRHREGGRALRARAAAVQPAHPLGHRPGGDHVFQRHHRPAARG